MPAVLEAINNMTYEEKIHTMDMLWTSIVSSPNQFETPAWHKDVLENRCRRVQSGEEKFIPWEEAKHQLQQEFA